MISYSFCEAKDRQDMHLKLLSITKLKTSTVVGIHFTSTLNRCKYMVLWRGWLLSDILCLMSQPVNRVEQ